MSLSSLNPGRLDSLITPRYPMVTRGTAGGAVQSWVTATASWAQWLPTTGREFIAANSRQAEVTGILRVRYRTDLAPTWRVMLDGALFDVLGLIEVGRRNFLDILVKTSPGSPAVTASAQVFEVSLEPGDSTAVIEYPLPFPSAPRGIYITEIMPVAGYTFNFAVISASRTALGCEIDLGAAVPAAGYKLSLQVTL